MTHLGRDLRFALRLHRRQPFAVGVIVAGLAVAIGLGTALFTVMNAALYRSANLPEGSIFRWAHLPARPVAAGYTMWPPWTYRDLQLLSGESELLRVAGMREAQPMAALGTGVSRPMSVAFVSPSFFPMVGGRPAAGRLLTPADDEWTVQAPVVMSHSVWMREFDTDPAVIGRTVALNGRPFTIVGVASRGFTGPTPSPPAFWAPLAVFDRDWRDGGRIAHAGDAVRMLIEVRGGLAPASAASEIARRAQAIPSLTGSGVTIEFEEVQLRSRVKEALGVSTTVSGVVVLLLLIGGANVANLLMSHASVRRPEIGVRLALGASRGRIVRQLLSESMLLAVVSGAVGWLLALWLSPILASIARLPPTFDLAPDGRTYVFLLVVTAAAGVLAGLAPSRHGARGDVRGVLSTDAARSPAGTNRFSRGVVAMQAAVAMVVLVLALLLTRGAWRAADADLGYDVERLLEVTLFPAGQETPASMSQTAALAAHLRTIPGVDQVALSANRPFSGSMRSVSYRSGAANVGVYLKETSAEYFPALGIPLRRGRTFSAAELATNAPVAVIAERLARDLWGSADAVGMPLDGLHSSLAGVRVIGVVADVLPHGLLDLSSEVTTLYRPLPEGAMGLAMIVRVRGDRTAAVGQVRDAIRSVAPGVRPSIHATGDEVARQRDVAAIPGRLARLALGAAIALTVIGVCGITAFTISQRRREIAVRMALGASPEAVLWRVLREGMRPVLTGLTVGLGLALLVARSMTAVFFGIAAHDPMSIAAAIALMFAATTIAIVVTARSATRLDPAQVLREG